MMKRFISRIKGNKRGQSFVELTLVTLILALLLSGVVEFGFMLNNYLHVLDAAREAARFSSSSAAFTIDAQGQLVDFYDVKFYYVTALKVAQTTAPVIFNPAKGDDIVISVFSVGGPAPVRFPLDQPNGWSFCSHYAGFIAYLSSLSIPVPDAVSGPGWNSCTPKTSKFDISKISAELGTLPSDTPPTGVLLVEVLYNYPQLLKLPVLTSVVPDPMPLYVYSMMPNAAAEPTPTPH